MSAVHATAAPWPRVVGLVVALAAAACTLGPDYRRPPLDPAAGYTQGALPADAGRGAGSQEGPQEGPQHFAAGRDIQSDWWTLYRCPKLAALVRAALAANPDLDTAAANLRQAHFQVQVSRTALFPTVNGQFNASRQAFSGAPFGLPSLRETFSLYTPTLNLSWSPDLFGATRRQIEGARAQAAYQRFQLEAARVSVSTNVVVTAIQAATLKAEITATERIVAIDRRLLGVAQQRLAIGATARSDVLAQQTALAQTEAGLPALRQQLQGARDRLAVLAGRFPSQGAGADIDLDELHLPETLPVSLPSALIGQRPDIAAADATLHAATAQVGVATANLLPQLSISAQAGSIATVPSDIFGPGTAIWSIGGQLTQPLFDAGKLREQRRIAIAAMQAAAAGYRSTVLGAFQDVAHALAALEADGEKVAVQDTAARSAADSLRLAQAQYASGGAAFLTLLNAEAADQQAQIAVIEARAARLTDTAALFQAMGGGWWNRPDAPDPAGPPEHVAAAGG